MMTYTTTLLTIFLLTLPELTQAAGRIEKNLDYKIDENYLEGGNFQYFYALLKRFEESDQFTNIMSELSSTPPEIIASTFLPLDVKKSWNPFEKHFLALAKFSFYLPQGLPTIDEKIFTQREYLQSTLPRYDVTGKDLNFHVGGSLITPDFDLTLKILKPVDHLVPMIPLIDQEKLKSGKIKVILMEQRNFGRVLIFKTAKMATALMILSEDTPDRTLVTQYILSNIINVPSKDLIKKGMIENLQDVVEGARKEIGKRVQRP